MGEIHNLTFFGQSSALFINSQSMSELQTWFRMIKKNANTGTWQKPSKNEGKAVVFSLIELGSILEVLEHNEKEFKTFHSRKDGIKTSISFNYSDESQQTLWINLGDYSKMLKGGELLFLRKMLDHIYNEKIVYATHGKREEDSK